MEDEPKVKPFATIQLGRTFITNIGSVRDIALAVEIYGAENMCGEDMDAVLGCVRDLIDSVPLGEFDVETFGKGRENCVDGLVGILGKRYAELWSDQEGVTEDSLGECLRSVVALTELGALNLPMDQLVEAMEKIFRGMKTPDTRSPQERSESIDRAVAEALKDVFAPKRSESH